MAQTVTDIDDSLSWRNWDEVSSFLQDTIKDLFDFQPIPSSPPPDPAGLEPGPAPSHSQYNNVPVVGLPEGFDQNLKYVGMINGKRFYALAAGGIPPSVPAAPQPSTSNSDTRKSESQQEDDRPYVKRPPNAFMLYAKEHRRHVEEDVKRMGCAAVSRVLGQRWKSLSAKEQAVYYQQAQREKELHAQQHPGWSIWQNYGKKRTKSRRAPKASVSSVAAVLKDSTSQTDEEEPRQQTAVVLLFQ